MRNSTIKKEILFNNLLLFEGETITLDLSHGAKTVVNSWAGNALNNIIPSSDLNTFSLESDPIAEDGENAITCLAKDATPIESNDGSDQLSDWIGITGLTLANTDVGTLYTSIVSDGGGYYHVNFYSNSGRTTLVGHTGTYNGAGSEAITADNASGVGGTITIDAVVGADTDIETLFTIIEFRHYNRWTSLDEAVQ